MKKKSSFFMSIAIILSAATLAGCSSDQVADGSTTASTASTVQTTPGIGNEFAVAQLSDEKK